MFRNYHTRVRETDVPRENNPELIKMNTIQVEERVVTGPYAIGDPEQNAHYLKPSDSVVYTNIAPKAKRWQVVADNQVVEVPQYLNMDGCKASQEGEIEAVEITPTPKGHTVVY